ncbi:adenosylcobinamide amidohydrolase [Asanoa ferruginea]|uniref:adenosylcobinamide amidohydrolase n=1 Tax=Asanoa ferruginea TaxID=53367 RepID=UPI000E2371D3|nr:adenosylcobinamide amidohydrolase [Asanoa ferruginea]
MPFKPILTARPEDGESIPLLVWRLPAPMRAISSAPLGGGIGQREWVINATVPMSYARDDPHAHLTSLASGLGLDGSGVGLLTGVDVTQRVVAADGAAEVWATVGLGAPILAAAEREIPRQQTPGTINIVAFAGVRLSDAALVNAVATITEAKAQALWELGLAATGTATDAVAVLCPTDGPAEPYGGPLSPWGARLARAAHRAILEGGSRPKIPWSER